MKAGIFYKANTSVINMMGIHPRILWVTLLIESVWNGEPVLITSVMEGEHMEGSLHYKGRAIDFRYPEIDRVIKLEKLRKALSGLFGMVLEKDHIHIEYEKD
jgi:hypothetical protein